MFIIWTPYNKIRNHPQDFNIRYKLYTKENRGRTHTYQGLRCDFLYDGDDIRDGIYAIHPEFEDIEGNVILDDRVQIKLTGTARMWILFSEMRESVHKDRTKVDVSLEVFIKTLVCFRVRFNSGPDISVYSGDQLKKDEKGGRITY